MAVDWTTVAVALGSGVVVGLVSYLFTERSNRAGFRRQREFDLKLEAYTDLLSAADRFVDALEAVTGAGLGDMESEVASAFSRAGFPPTFTKELSSQLGRFLSDTLTRMRWRALGFEGPVYSGGPNVSKVETQGPEFKEALGALEKAALAGTETLAGAPSKAAPPNLGAILASVMQQVDTHMLPASAVLTEARKKLDVAYVRLHLLDVPPEVEAAMDRFRAGLGRVTESLALDMTGGGGGLGEAAVEKLRNDWGALGEACGADLKHAMR